MTALSGWIVGDSSYSVALFTSFGLFLIYLAIKSWFRQVPANLPPGPYSPPIVGYLPFLRFAPHVTLNKLKQKYGNVFSIYLGSKYTIVLSDYKAVRDAFSQNAFLDRPPNPPNQIIRGTLSFASSSGHVWKEQKKFALQVLRDLGYGKSRMEEFMKEEVRCLVNVLDSYKGQPMPVRRYLAPSTSNNIFSLVFGKRLDYDNPQRVLLDRVIHQILHFFKPTGIHAYFPWMKKAIFYFGLWGYDKLEVAVDKMLEFVDEEIKHHDESLDASNIRDYLDGFLLQMRNKKEDKNTTFTMPMLKGNLASLFGAGSSTVSCTLEWLILTMGKYPEVQKKCQAEVDDVIGREREPCWVDHTSMPYVESVLTEIQRWKTVVPLNLVRYAIEDANVQGYFIPKGTVVFANLWDVHHDPNVFKDSDTFIADRFLSEDGKEYIKSDAFMPFTVGKRACPGEQFALVEMFLYFSNLLQKYDIVLPPGAEINMEGVQGVIFEPNRYEMCFKARS